MNRRGFLAALIAAPVAATVPAIVTPIERPFVGLAPKRSSDLERYVTHDGDTTTIWLVHWGSDTVQMVRR